MLTSLLDVVTDHFANGGQEEFWISGLVKPRHLSKCVRESSRRTEKRTFAIMHTTLGTNSIPR